VTCHRFGRWRSHFISVSCLESGSAAKESGDKSPHSKLQEKLAVPHTVRFVRRLVTQFAWATLLALLGSHVGARAEQPLEGGLPRDVERELAQRFRDAGASVETWDNGNIRALILNANFGDADMPVVAGLANLHWLNLYGTNVTDRGLNSLRPLTQLRGIFLSSHITDKGVEVLRVFTDLERLSFENCERVTDRGFAHVGQLHKLTDVNTPINISDDVVPVLLQFDHVATLTLHNSNVSEAGIKQLQEHRFPLGIHLLVSRR
jgi:hypothetical protein